MKGAGLAFVVLLLFLASWIGQANSVHADGLLTWPVPSAPQVVSWFDHDSPGQRSSSYLPFRRYDGYLDGSTNALCTGPLTCNCAAGVNCYNGHVGVDVSTGGLYGQPIIAAASGTVTGAPGDAGDGFGRKVRLWHQGLGIATIYAHMDTWAVQQNQFVTRGQLVGYSGCTGDCYGAHLHFGVYNAQTGGNPIDPYGWSGGGSDPWPYDQGYLWMTHPPRPPYFTHYQPIAGVINAGGNGDIGLRDSTNGRFYFRWGDGGGSSFCCETPFDWAIGDHYEAFTADINNNGCGDIGLRDPNNGSFYVKYGNCSGGFAGQTEFPWAPGYHYRPFVCDVNGNGYPDVGLFDPYNGKFYVKYGNGSGQFYGQTEWYWTVGVHYQPFARDFNLYGRCDIGLRDPNNGVFYIRWGNGDGTFGNQVTYDWGAPGYHYVPFTIRISIPYHWGDIGLRDPNNGIWYFRKGNGSGSFCCQTIFPWAPT